MTDISAERCRDIAIKMQPILNLIEKTRDEVNAILELVGYPANQYQTMSRAADYFDLPEAAIRELVAAGRLIAYEPLSGHVLVDRSEVDAAIRASALTSKREGTEERA